MPHIHTSASAPSALATTFATLIRRGRTYDDIAGEIWPDPACRACAEEQAVWIPEAWGWRKAASGYRPPKVAA